MVKKNIETEIENAVSEGKFTTTISDTIMTTPYDFCNCELNGDNSIQINQGGTLSGPFATLEKGRYKVKFSGDNLTACIFSCNSDSNDIDITIEEQTDEEIIYRFTLLEKTENIEFKFSCNPNADAPVYIDGYLS